MPVRARQRLVALLLGVFFLQTWLVYSDPAGRSTPRLSALAAAGSRVWHEHNCQSCHQLYGFGGFLGPDLTNAADRLTPARIDAILTNGSGQMPAFRLPPADQRAMQRFLEEIDATGVGQLRAYTGEPPSVLLARLVSIGSGQNGGLSESAALGRDIVLRENCVDCHLPNHQSAYQAPDLTLATGKHGREKLLSILASGVPGKPMPIFRLTPEQQTGVHDFLVWLGQNGVAIRNGFEVTKRAAESSILDLPWFEYR